MMMMPPKRKGIAALIIKKFNGKDEEKSKPSENGVEQDYSEGYDACCDEMIEAFEQKDSKALKKALMHFMDMYSHNSEGGEKKEDY